MSKKHTPGPWEIEPHSRIDKCFNVGPGISIDYDDVDHEEQDANARLIAAAPELLEACEKSALIPNRIEGMSDVFNEGYNEGVCAVLRELSAAIKKAKGE